MFEDDYALEKTIKVKVRSFDYHITPRYEEHYVQGEYEDLTLDLWDSVIKQGDTVCDVGGHYGIYSLVAGRKVQDQGRVVAFDPIFENIQLFERNVTENGLTNVSIEQVAVSDKPGKASFNMMNASDSGSFYDHPLASIKKKIDVRVESIDHYFREDNRVDVIKIDTEGNEINVLEGARKTLKKNPHAKLFIEFNPACLKKARHNPGDIFVLLDRLGYDVFFVLDWDRKIVKYDMKQNNWLTILDGHNYINLYCSAKDTQKSILLSSHSGELGGAESALLDTIKGLVARNYICNVVLPGPGRLADSLRRMPVGVVNIESYWWCYSGEKLDEIAKTEDYYIKNGSAIHQIAHTIDLIRPDVVISNTLVAPWAAFASAGKRPHIWIVHEYGDLDHNFIFKYGYKESLRAISEYSSAVVVNSKSVLNRLKEAYPFKNITQLYLNFPPQAIADIHPPLKASAALRLVIVGRVIESKGQLDVVRAVGKLVKKGKQVHLVIVGGVGSQKYLAEIMTMIKKGSLADCVEIVGYKDDPTPLVANADVAIVASNNEAFGKTTVEAMLLAKPVIGADSGGTAEIITNNKDGLLYSPGDYEDLANKIELLLETPDEIKRLGDSARISASKKFLGNAWLEGVIGLIEQAKVVSRPDCIEASLLLDLARGADGARALNSRNAELQERTLQLERTVAELQRHAQSITNSVSWRATRPLRAAKRIVTKRRGDSDCNLEEDE